MYLYSYVYTHSHTQTQASMRAHVCVYLPNPSAMSKTLTKYNWLEFRASLRLDSLSYQPRWSFFYSMIIHLPSRNWYICTIWIRFSLFKFITKTAQVSAHNTTNSIYVLRRKLFSSQFRIKNANATLQRIFEDASLPFIFPVLKEETYFFFISLFSFTVTSL